MAAKKMSLKEQVYTKIFNDLVVERFHPMSSSQRSSL